MTLSATGGPPPGFLAFWAAYPRKVGKLAAARAWARLGCEGLADRIMATLDWQNVSEDWTKDGGRYVPHPTTWLNQGRWDDEPGESGRVSRGDPRGEYIAPRLADYWNERARAERGE